MSSTDHLLNQKQNNRFPAIEFFFAAGKHGNKKEKGTAGQQIHVGIENRIENNSRNHCTGCQHKKNIKNVNKWHYIH